MPETTIQEQIVREAHEIEAIKLFDELIRSTKPGGEIIVFSQFNEMHADTQITHRKYNQNGEHNGWEKGFNNYSQKTIHNWLNSKVKNVEFIAFFNICINLLL